MITLLHARQQTHFSKLVLVTSPGQCKPDSEIIYNHIVKF